MLFSFFKTKGTVSSSELIVDMHSHLIPAIDDGAKDIEESLSLLRTFESLGYHKIITTPHVMLDAYNNTPRRIMEGLEYLSSKAKQAGIRLEIEAAAEYYLDEGFIEHLHAGDILTIADEYILFETSYIAKPLYFDEMLVEMVSAGYKPLLAHPERYRYIHNFESEYRSLKEKGVFFQININSFGGYYGKDSKKKAEFLNKNGMIDFLGSDAHHMKQLETLSIIRKKNFYKDMLKNNTILNNTI